MDLTPAAHEAVRKIINLSDRGEITIGELERIIAELAAADYGREITPAGEKALMEAAIDRMGWEEIRVFLAVLRRGQALSEDAGGFFLRAIKTLFGIKIDPVRTYKDACAAFVEKAYAEQLEATTE